MSSCAVLNAAWPTNIVQVVNTPLESCTTLVVLDPVEYNKIKTMINASPVAAQTFDPAQAVEFWGFGLTLVLFCYLIATKSGVIISMIRKN